MFDKLIQGLRDVAPTLATGLAVAAGAVNPAAGLAVRMVSTALLGHDTGTPEEMEVALASATPEQRLALRQADQAYAIRMRELDVEERKTENANTADARAREVHLRDRTPMLLAFTITFGFFAILVWVLTYGMPDKGGEALLVMLGSLGAGFGAVVNYFFGSSASSAEKTRLLRRAPT